jgi:hypothetical protein
VDVSVTCVVNVHELVNYILDSSCEPDKNSDALQTSVSSSVKWK